MNFRIVTISLAAVLIGVFTVLHAQSVRGSAEPVPALVSEPAQVVNTPINCRFGVGYIYQSAGADAWIPTLGAGWLVNFSWYEVADPYAEYVFTIRLKQTIVDSVRLPEYTVSPPLTDYYEENGQIIPGLGTFVKNSPGRLWLVGNEIEIHNHRQDNMMPDLYARAYHEIYNYIKEVDPTAQVAIGSVTMATPGRMQYLDIIWDTYKELYGTEMPVDVWNIHLYILAERTPRPEPQHGPGKIALGTDPNLAILTSVDDPKKCPLPGLPDTDENDPRPDVYCMSERDSVRIFTDQIYRIRQWMKDHGQQDKPLIISEFGQLPGYDPNHEPGTCSKNHLPDEFGNCMDPERVTTYLEGTTRLMNSLKDADLGYPHDENRLVQRWLWYSLNEHANGIGGASNLLVNEFRELTPGSEAALTMMGQAFRREALSNSYPPNLLANYAPSPVVFVDTPQDTATVTIDIPLTNSGSLNVTDYFDVTIYRDVFTTQPIETITIDPNLTGAIAGCNWEGEARDTVSFTLSGLGVGKHPYWVKLDSNNFIRESAEFDNIAAGVIEVYSSSVFSYRNYVPAIRDN